MIKHGTDSCYAAGCHRPECMAAHARAHNLYRLRIMRGEPTSAPAWRVSRRLQALAAAGWPTSTIEELTGINRRNLRVLRQGAGAFVQWRTLERVSQAYERLSAHPGPSERSRTYAARQGWHPPLWWVDIDAAEQPEVEPDHELVDEVAIERAIDGRPTRLSHAEKREAVRILAGRGHSDAAIAWRCCCATETVLRIRQRYGIAPGVPPQWTRQEVGA